MKALQKFSSFLILFLTAGQLTAQIASHQFYLGPTIGVQFHNNKKIQGLNGGGILGINQRLLSDPALFQQIFTALGGEPFLITGPNNLSASSSFSFGGQAGFFVSRNWSVDLSTNYSSLTATGELIMTYGSLSGGTMQLPGNLNTEVTNWNSALTTTYYFGNNWMPYVRGGLLLNSQSAQPAKAEFGQIVFETNTAVKGSQIGGVLSTGISKTFGERHLLAINLEGIGYSSPYTASTFIIEPAVQAKYNFLIPTGKKTQSYSIPNLTAPQVELCSSSPLQDDIDRLFKELDSLTKAEKDAKKAMDDNDLAKEVQSIRDLIDALTALDQLDELGEETLEALEDFVGCNDEKLRKLFKESESARNGAINSLKFLSNFLKIFAKKNPDESPLLNKISKIIEEQVEKAEKAMNQGDIDKALDIIMAIKTKTAWPVDVLKIILDDLWKQIDDAINGAGEKGAKKALEILLKKILGATAGAAGSIAQDIINFADFLWKWHNYDELKGEWNKKMIEILDRMKAGGMGVGTGFADGCVSWAIPGIKKITLSVEMYCWCPSSPGSKTDGEWKTVNLDMDPHDAGNSKQLTFETDEESGTKNFKFTVPEKSNRPCSSDHCYVKLTIYGFDEDGKIIGKSSGFSGNVR